jgi:hypothetical protein
VHDRIKHGSGFVRKRREGTPPAAAGRRCGRKERAVRALFLAGFAPVGAKRLLSR